ncbi:MAG: DNA polymerase I [Helicobacteraceae bacterium]|jgi:DNA polymerase-1|nr:DNA polymerase I [Helicobacteraceae bacterium]
MKTIAIIDTFGFFFRSYHALPPLTDKSGFPTGLLTGFINFIGRVVKDNGDYIVFTAESPEKSFRHTIYADYKANRKPPDEALLLQIPIALEWIEKMGFALARKSGFEADDIIASIASKAKSDGYFSRIISGDKDMYQLIDGDKISVFDPMKQRVIDAKACVEKFGVEPKDFIEFQAILGDSSDNVPGVKGIGEKGAAKLINEYKTLENIYKNIDKIMPERVRNLLIESKQEAFLSRQLVTLDKTAIDKLDYESFAIPSDPIFSIADELAKYDIRAALKRAEKNAQTEAIDAKKTYKNRSDRNLFDDEPKIAAAPFESVLITDEKTLLDTIDAIPKNAIVAFDTETDSLDVRAARLTGFSFAWSEEIGYYAAVGHRYLGAPAQISIECAKEAIKKIFSKAKIIGQNLKFDLHILNHSLGINNLAIENDTMLIAWLIDPEKPVGLDELAKNYLNHEMISFKSVTKGLNNFSEVELSTACRYASEDAVMTLRLYPILLERLKTLNEAALKILLEVEISFMRVLQELEDTGLEIDAPFFASLHSKMQEEIASLTDRIYALAGESFNLNSTQQLGVVLFERLKLPSGKKTKKGGGYSTDESVLSALSAEHPIVNELLNYRELAKLRSTYIEPFIAIAQRSKRVHTHFSQVGTATGRLSSSEPNLQNIPARTETGRQIRRGFIAKKGFIFLSADYSQIELRLLAHFSGDQTLIEAFKNRRDIHLETAKALFGDKANESRHIAKSVNFGLIYGMGQRKLSADIGISPAEAKRVIEDYFAKFPTIKAYIESLKRDAHSYGYVSTLLGRRRYFDFENARDQHVARFEREAVNTRFQGSAADLIKLAMLNINRVFKENSRVKMALQIHDELLFETTEEDADKAAETIKREMQNAYALNVPLEVSLSRAKNWADLK